MRAQLSKPSFASPAEAETSSTSGKGKRHAPAVSYSTSHVWRLMQRPKMPRHPFQMRDSRVFKGFDQVVIITAVQTLPSAQNRVMSPLCGILWSATSNEVLCSSRWHI